MQRGRKTIWNDAGDERMTRSHTHPCVLCLSHPACLFPVLNACQLGTPFPGWVLEAFSEGTILEKTSVPVMLLPLDHNSSSSPFLLLCILDSSQRWWLHLLLIQMPCLVGWPWRLVMSPKIHCHFQDVTTTPSKVSRDGEVFKETALYHKFAVYNIPMSYIIQQHLISSCYSVGLSYREPKVIGWPNV